MNSSSAADNENRSQARIVGRVEIKTGEAGGPAAAGGPAHGVVSGAMAGKDKDDEGFMQALASSPWMTGQLERECGRVLAEIAELRSENRWDDINALFHPLEEKVPELCAAGMDARIRQEVAFSLGRAGRHRDAIECIKPLVKREPDNAMAHYTLAYSALDLLYAARTKRQLLTPAGKREMIELAHRHFSRARKLCPDSVTFFYREAILFKEIEEKHRKAIPLFARAVANWDRLSEREKKRLHQQRPKFVRSLYHMASSHLKLGMPARSLEVLERLMDEDRNRDYVSPVFKHFAMAKVLYALGRPAEALDHLEAAQCRAGGKEHIEYVHELAARCGLMLGNVEKALSSIEKIPPARRRPYVNWTFADVLVAAGREKEALDVLERTADRDRRSRHVALIRAARIQYSRGRMDDALRLASDAASFCETTFGNASNEALFWKGAALHGLGRSVEALEVLEDLVERRFQYPGMGRLIAVVRKAARKGQGGGDADGRPVMSLVV